MKIFTTLILSILLIGSMIIISDAASSGDDPTGGSPPPSGGGGGGGSPQYYDYYIPLIFDESHKDGISEVVVWLIQPSTVITSFAQDKSGTNSIETREPVKLVFNPRDNSGLTNGSLIRTTVPALIVGQRNTQDIYTDTSFGYSILSDRMMGFEFTSPVDGYINVLSSTSATINTVNPSEILQPPVSILRPYTTTQIKVEKGSYINGTGPMSATFISYEDGTFASMAVPKYMKGNNYVFDSELLALRTDEIDRSFISVVPDEPTELTFIYEDGSTSNTTIFGISDFALSSGLRGINSSRGEIDVNINLKVEYANVIRRSLVQLFAASEMRAGELFVSPRYYSTHYSVSSMNNNFNILYYDGSDPANAGYFLSNRDLVLGNKYDTHPIISDTIPEIIIANDSLFSIITSPGLVNNPMAPSISFLNIPLNTQTTKNITGLEATWYRFPNIAVGLIEINPGPLEEYTGQSIHIEIYSNGSLPASHFKITIQIDDEELIEKEFDFVGANETIEFDFNRFFNFGKDRLNITVEVDIDNEVNEINEDDNSLNANYNVSKNVRLRSSIYLIILILVVILFLKTRSWLKNQKKMSRTHVDVLITEEINE